MGVSDVRSDQSQQASTESLHIGMNIAVSSREDAGDTGYAVQVDLTDEVVADLIQSGRSD